jgi:hypothetical protein
MSLQAMHCNVLKEICYFFQATKKKKHLIQAIVIKIAKKAIKM